jgi:heme A synthase
LATFSWALLGYNLLVILWGAFVRATGSGAGCGAHWPLCNGEVIPRAPALETMIEFAHRVSSGLVIPLVLVLVVWVFRSTPRGSLLRKSASLVVFFTLTEALVGAGLVLFEMVAHNTSIARAYWMIAHLINTFLLLAMLTASSIWATVGVPERLHWDRKIGPLVLLGFLAMLVLGASGAVTALGDTLFPVNSFQEGLQREFSATAHAFERLRVWHPLIAVLVGSILAGIGAWLRARSRDPRLHTISYVLIGTFLVQLVLGAINVILLAPVWMQLVHLAVADLIWMSLVTLGLLVFGSQPLVAHADQPVQNRVGEASGQVG